MTSQPPNEPLHLSHVFGSTRRRGHWRVPAHVTLRQRMGSSDLDFTEAEFTGTETVLDIDMVGGSIELRVSDDTVVESDVATVLASYQDHREDTADRTGHVLRLHGRAVWGSVEVKGPRKPRRFGR